MEQVALIALGVLLLVGFLYALWGSIEAGSGWRSWLVEAVLPFYALIVGGLICLLAVSAVAVWSWRTVFGG